MAGSETLGRRLSTRSSQKSDKISTGRKRKEKHDDKKAAKKAKKATSKNLSPAQGAKMLLRQLNKLEEEIGFRWRCWVNGYIRIRFRESSGNRPVPGAKCWVGDHSPDTDGYYRLQIPAAVRDAWSMGVTNKTDALGQIAPVMQTKVAVHVLALMACGEITQDSPDSYETDHLCGRESCIRHITYASRADQQARGGCFQRRSATCGHTPVCMTDLNSPNCPVFVNQALVDFLRTHQWFQKAEFRFGRGSTLWRDRLLLVQDSLRQSTQWPASGNRLGI